MTTLVVSIVINAIFASFLWANLKRVPARYRRQEPGLAWMCAIPLFNLFWGFFVLPRLSQGLVAYFHTHDRPDVGMASDTLGVVVCVVHVLSLAPVVGEFASIVWFFLMIVFLVRTGGLARQIPLEEAGEVA